jgi:putative ABC transport system permease protein
VSLPVRCLAAVRRVVVPAVDGLRTYRGTAVLVAATCGIAGGLAEPVFSLALPGSAATSTRLRSALSTAPDPGLPWLPGAISPAAELDRGITLLYQLLALSGLALLGVAALAVSTMLVARALDREPEVAVRRAVGAARGGLFASAALEGACVALAAMLAGGLLGTLATRAALGTWPGEVATGTPSPRLLALGALSGVIFLGGLLPLLFARARTIEERPATSLPLALPALQLGASLVVLTTAALVARAAAGRFAPGTSPDRGLRYYVVTAPDGAPAERATRYAALLDRMKGRSRETEVSLQGAGTAVGIGTEAMVITDCGDCVEGGIRLPFHSVVSVHSVVSADSFHALNIPLVEGRSITRSDDFSAPRVVVISESLARKHFQYGHPLGRALRVGLRASGWYTVVGVVKDRPPETLAGAMQPQFAVYLSVLQHPARSVELTIPSSAGAAADAVTIPELARSLDVTSEDVQVLDDRGLRSGQWAIVDWFARWFGRVGWATLLIAVAGTAVMMRLWAGSMLAELSIRRAVGATGWRVMTRVLARAALVGIAGTTVGLWFGPMAWNGFRAIAPTLPPWDLGALLRYSLLLIAAAMAGALVPALRAAQQPPARHLAGAAE